MTVYQLKMGDQASVTKTISESDVYLFAGITGDLNPAHVDSVSAQKGIFKDRVAHGILTTGLISAVIGMKLPGPGTVYLGQEVRFTKPVYFGDTITAICRVTFIEPDKNLVHLETVCTNQRGESVIIGSATVMPPKVKAC